jgi:hypothetical protein
MEIRGNDREDNRGDNNILSEVRQMETDGGTTKEQRKEGGGGGSEERDIAGIQ